jgi:hypothetical protein
MSSPLNLSIDPDALEPIIRQAVVATVAELEAHRDRLGDKLAFSEPEAAHMLSMEPHQLRDERRRGRISASQVVNRGIRYTKQDLLNYLSRQRVGAKRGAHDRDA